jgi:hypothetical protein
MELCLGFLVPSQTRERHGVSVANEGRFRTRNSELQGGGDRSASERLGFGEALLLGVEPGERVQGEHQIAALAAPRVRGLGGAPVDGLGLSQLSLLFVGAAQHAGRIDFHQEVARLEPFVAGQ